MRNLFARSRRVETSSVIVTWNYLRCSCPTDETHPYHFASEMFRWIAENAQGTVYLIKYGKFDLRKTHKINAKKLSTAIESYCYIDSLTDHIVKFMNLEFTNPEDRTLFLLTWIGRVKQVNRVDNFMEI